MAATEELDEVEVEESGTVDEEGSGSTACPAFLRILGGCAEIFQAMFQPGLVEEYVGFNLNFAELPKQINE